MGVFLPLFLSPNDNTPHLYHLSGVASVGVGDSFAAIIGSKYGVTKWPRRKKTVEGSLAMGASMAAFLLVARLFCTENSGFVVVLLVSTVLSAVEAVTDNIDNIILPSLGYLLL
ncbi:unnamed protein product [Nippostrongylus brasiliensis]|uniref:dolichol kinase n=1 Tax=Nippostrongylus brasiliensis TaxID=27835 RepID=A0A0N4YNV8_NIPBR|nr:unnamed protein product [Nippostrongylus brasiliensis]